VAETMTKAMERRACLFRNGRNQALRIPREFEFDADEVSIVKDGGRLIVEPIERAGLLELLADWEPLDDAFPDIDETLLPLDGVEL
jgi:antitoxin VapB